MSILVNLVPNADTLVFHFSSRNKGAGKFHKYPVPDGVSNVYLNPADLNWYLDGLPDFDGLDNTVSELKNIVKQSKATKIVCIGSSMGAWGAAYIGPMIDANKIILFGPELALNGFASYSAQNISQRGSNVPKIAASSNCEYTVICGMLSPSDVHCTVNFFEGSLPKSCYFIPNMDHNTAFGLKEMGLLNRVMWDTINGESSNSTLDVIQYEKVQDLSIFFQNKEFNFKLVEEYCLKFINKDMKAKFFVSFGNDLLNKKLYHFAYNLLSKANTQMVDDNINMLLLRAARRSKRNEQALKIADDLIKSPKHRRNALWEKALVLERMGNLEESKLFFNKVYQEHLEDPIYKAAFEKIKDNS